MAHKVIIQTADGVIYEGETYENTENKMTIWNYHPVIGNTGDDRKYVLQLDDIQRIYLFDVSTVQVTSYETARNDQVPYSIVLTGSQLSQRIRMITLSLDEYVNIEKKLASQVVDQPINLEGVSQLAITYELTDKLITKISIDTGRVIVSYAGPSIDMALIKRIFEDSSIIKVMYNGRVFKSSLTHQIKFVNVFDVMMAHFTLNTTRLGETPAPDIPIEKVCKEYLGLPLPFFEKSRVVAYLLPVFFRQESILRLPFHHTCEPYHPQGRSDMARQYVAAPWIVSDQVTR